MNQTVESYYAQHRLDRFVAPAQIGQLSLQRFEKGQQICELDQPIAQLSFFVEGRVKVLVPAENARQLLLCFYQPLQLFGDLELFDRAPRASATIEALTPCVCLALSHAFVLSQLAGDPVFLQQLYIGMSGKLRRVIGNSALNLLHPLERRLASYILASAVSERAGDLVFAGNLSQIADALGTSFRHLHRTLQSLCEQGVLAKEGTRYRIRQAGELERRAAGAYTIA